MGSLALQYPSISGASVQDQLNSLRGYLITLTDQLNGADWSANTVLSEISTAIDASRVAGETEQKLSGYAALKSLIIKTADFAMSESEQFQTKISGNYVAVSDFGKYWQNATMTVDGNEFGIRQLYDFSCGVNNGFTVNSQQYVKTGLLYYDGALPVYGVGVGNIATATQEGETVIDKTQNELLTVTPNRVSFWQDGLEVAYLSGKKLHFPAGTLEATSAVLSGTVTAASGSKIGVWNVTDNCLYQTSPTWGASNGLYFGRNGLSIKNKFTVDSAGNLECTGADITGTIYASSLYIGGVNIAGKLDALMDYVTTSGLYDGEISADQIESGQINTNKIDIGDGEGRLGTDRTSIFMTYGDGGAACVVSEDGGAFYTEGGSLWAGGAYAGVTGLTWVGGSDRSLKDRIRYDENYDAFFDSLKPATFVFQKTPDMIHTGMIAQDVLESLEKCGLTDGKRYVGFVPHSPVDEHDTKKYDYGLAYEEFISLCIDQIQKLKTRVKALEETA